MEENKRLKSWLKRKIRITEALFVAFLISGSVAYANTNAGLAIGGNGEVISEITNGYYPSITKKETAALKGTAVVEMSSDVSGLRPYNYHNQYNKNYEEVTGLGSHTGDSYSNQDKQIKSIAIGDYSKAKDGGIALGSYAYARHRNDLQNPTYQNGLAIAIGNWASATDLAAMAIGAGANASGVNSLAMMRQSAATGRFAAAIGTTSAAVGDGSIALGQSSTAEGQQSIAIGSSDTVTNFNITGKDIYEPTTSAHSKGKKSIAIGSGATSENDNSLALGAGAKSTLQDSVALGQGATTQNGTKISNISENNITYNNFSGTLTKDNMVVSLGTKGGERQLQHVAAGKISNDSTDAINGSQLYSVIKNASWTIQNKGKEIHKVHFGDTVDFIDGDGTTAEATKDSANNNKTNVKYSVNRSSLTVDSNTGMVSAEKKDGSHFATAEDVAKAINDSEKSTIVKSVDETLVKIDEKKNTTKPFETEYTISLGDKTKKAIEDVTSKKITITGEETEANSFTVAEGGNIKVISIGNDGIVKVGADASKKAITVGIDKQKFDDAVTNNKTVQENVTNIKNNKEGIDGLKNNTIALAGNSGMTNSQSLSKQEIKFNIKGDGTYLNAEAKDDTVTLSLKDKSITAEKISDTAKGKLTSGTLEVTGEGNTLGKDINIELKDNSVTKEKLSDNVQLGFAGNSGSGAVKLKDGTFTIKGENGIITNASDSNLVVKIDEETKKKIDNAADTNLSNVTNEGKKVIQGLVDMEDGENTKASSRIDGDIKKFKVDVKADGRVENGNQQIVTGDTVYKAIEKNKIHYFSINNPDEIEGNYNNDGATGKNAMAIGKNTGAMGQEAIAVGTKAYAKADNTVVFGKNAVAEKSGGIAIGAEVYANMDSTIVLGKNATANKSNSVAIGKAVHANGERSFVLGEFSTTSGENSFVVGTNSHAKGSRAVVFGSGNTSDGNNGFSVGISNHAKADSSVAQGRNNVTEGKNSIAVGIYNVTKSNNAIAQGIDNVAEGSNSFAAGYHNIASKDRSIAMGINSNAHGNGAVAIGRSSTANKENGIVMGIDSHVNGDNAMAIGNHATANQASSVSIGKDVHANAENSVVIGRDSGTQGANSLAIGSRAFTNNKDSVVIGNEVSSTAEKTIILGDHSYANAKNSVVIGMNSTVNAENTVSIGNASHAKGESSISFGASSVSDAKKSIALGAESIANREAGVKGESFGAVNTEGAVWTATLGALSIGENSTKTRQITGVAAGKEDTDAVNVAQLKQIKHNIDKNSHLNYTTDTKSGVIDFQKNEVLGILGDGEVLTYQGKENKYLSTELDEKGNVRVHLTDKTKETLGKADTAMQSWKLQANGKDDTDVKNGELVNFKDGKNVTVVKKERELSFDVKGDLQDISSISNGTTKLSFSEGKNEISVHNAKITNVAAGTQDTDAVNVSQLEEAKAAATTKVKAGTNIVSVTSEMDPVTKASTYTINAKATEVVGDGEIAVTSSTDNQTNVTTYKIDSTALSTKVNQNKEELKRIEDDLKNGVFSVSANGAEKDNIAINENIDFSSGNENITVSYDKSENKFTHTLSNTLKEISSIQNDKGTGFTIGDKTITFVNPSDSKQGVQLKNIADGTDPNDAVNKGQLDQAKAAATTKVDKLDENVIVKAENNKDGSTTYKVGLANKLSIGKEETAVSLDGDKGTLNVGKRVFIDGMTGAASFDKVVIKGDTGTIDGLTNKEWDPNKYVTGQAATEDQLKVLDKKIQDNTEDLVNKGMNFAGNDYDETDESTIIHKNLGERFEVVGRLKSDMEASSDNIRTRVLKDKQQLEILMSERPVFKEVTAGTDEKTKVVIGDSGIQVGGNTYISKEGMNANGKKITNVGAGELSSTSTDAVNGAQLYAAQKAATTKVVGDKNVTVGSVSNEDGSTTYKVSLNDKISLGDKISLDGTTGNADFGKVKVNGENGEITGLTNTTTKGESFAKVGRAATEEQLKEVQDNVTTKIDNLSTELTDKGMNFAGNSGETVHKNLGETLAVKGSGSKDDDQYSSENIKTRVQNGELEIMLDKHVSVDTLTAKEGLDIIGKPGKDGKNTEAKIFVKEGEAGVIGTDGENMDRIVYKDSKNREHTLATHDDGMKYGGDIGESIKKQLNETVNVRGGITYADKLSQEANIGVVSDGKDNLTIRLAKDIKDLSSITLLDPSGNKTVIHGEGVTIIPKDGKEIKLSNKGLDNGGNKITNIAGGTESNDAVNVGQLNEVKEVINNHAAAISNNTRKIEKMHGDMRRGFANAAAMSTLKFMEIGMNQATVGAAIGTYKGNQAVAVGVQTAPTENIRVHANVSIAPSREQVDTMAGVGASWRFNLK
ncbi:YadA-like family protein [Fusobacterium necrophorum]|uniref:YadA-like family protein n=1 Tax=Fusobacterium necrophorum TaxID=859 RepID=UPI00254F8986|nr:YadA-like family protein [Fusobacterium necrophorum]MDK4522722.1 YadA-like family protein [Fusobacterium necrophorum]